MSKEVHNLILEKHPEYKDQIQYYRNEFKNEFLKRIKRPGADKLLDWLENTSDFFEAPASTRYHLAVPGGLCQHSFNVYTRLIEEFIQEKRRYTTDPIVSLTDAEYERIAICALLHDVCKADFYTVELRNKKDENGKWISYPAYSIDDQCPFGHGEKSVYIISAFMKLSREEALAIRWHMGGFDESVKGGSTAQSQAFNKYTLCTLLHIADLKAAYIDERNL